MVELLENLLYISMNNITSACVSREHFQNAYVFESNLYLRNPSLIRKYRYESCYLGVPSKCQEQFTSSLCFFMV